MEFIMNLRESNEGFMGGLEGEKKRREGKVRVKKEEKVKETRRNALG